MKKHLFFNSAFRPLKTHSVKAGKHYKNDISQPNQSYSKQQLRLQAKLQERMIKKIGEYPTKQQVKLQKYIEVMMQLNPRFIQSHEKFSYHITSHHMMSTLLVLAIIGTSLYAFSNIPMVSAHEEINLQNKPHTDTNLGVEITKKVAPEFFEHAISAMGHNKFTAWSAKLVAETSERVHHNMHEHPPSDAVGIGLIQAMITLRLHLLKLSWPMLISGVADVTANHIGEMNKDVPLDQRIRGAALASNLAAAAVEGDPKLVEIGEIENAINGLKAFAIPERLINTVSTWFFDHLKEANELMVKGITSTVRHTHEWLTQRMPELYEAWCQATDGELQDDIDRLEALFVKECAILPGCSHLYSKSKMEKDNTQPKQEPTAPSKITPTPAMIKKLMAPKIAAMKEIKQKIETGQLTREQYEEVIKPYFDELDRVTIEELESAGIDTKHVNLATPHLDDMPRILQEEAAELARLKEIAKQRVDEYLKTATQVTFFAKGAPGVRAIMVGHFDKQQLAQTLAQTIGQLAQQNQALETMSVGAHSQAQEMSIEQQKGFIDISTNQFPKSCPDSHPHEWQATFGDSNTEGRTSVQDYCVSDAQQKWHEETRQKLHEETREIEILREEYMRHVYPF